MTPLVCLQASRGSARSTHRQTVAEARGWPSASPDTGQKECKEAHPRTFGIHRLFQDDLYPLHVVPVPEAVQGLAVLVSERQDLSHGLAGKETGCAARSSRDEVGVLTPRKGPKPSRPRSEKTLGAMVPGLQGFPAQQGLKHF